MRRMTRYSGSKLRYYSLIFNLLKRTKKKIYVEPFLGSGSIFISLPDLFDKYVISDKNKYLMKVWLSIKEFQYKDFVLVKKFIEKKFGDIKNNKESYYEYRNFYNEKYFNTNKKEEGIYLYFLMNTCMNSMIRFSKNGFNQSFGNCFYFLDEDTFLFIKNRLKKAILLSDDYTNVMNEYNKDCMYILDPPYENSGKYDIGFDNNYNIDVLLKKIMYLKSRNDILFFNSLNKKMNTLLLNDFKIRKLDSYKSVQPKGSKEEKREHIILFNIKKN